MVVSNTAEALAMALPLSEAGASTKRVNCWAPETGSALSSTVWRGSSFAVEGYGANAGLGGMLLAGWPLVVFTARLAAVVAYWPQEGRGPVGGDLPLAGGT